MSKAHSLGLFTGATTGIGRPFWSGTHGGTFIVGANAAGAAGTVVLEGSSNNVDWYPVLAKIETPVAVSIAVTTGVTTMQLVMGEHAYLRARCTLFTSGTIPTWFVPRSRN